MSAAYSSEYRSSVGCARALCYVLVCLRHIVEANSWHETLLLHDLLEEVGSLRLGDLEAPVLVRHLVIGIIVPVGGRGGAVVLLQLLEPLLLGSLYLPHGGAGLVGLLNGVNFMTLTSLGDS